MINSAPAYIAAVILALKDDTLMILKMSVFSSLALTSSVATKIGHGRRLTLRTAQSFSMYNPTCVAPILIVY